MSEVAGAGTAAWSRANASPSVVPGRCFFCIGEGILRNHCDNLMNKPPQRIARDSSA